MSNRWKKLSDEQLLGADYALRLAMTSPVIRGQAAIVIEGMQADAQKEINRRNASPPPQGAPHD